MNSRKTVQESFTDVGDAMNAFGDVLKQILGISALDILVGDPTDFPSGDKGYQMKMDRLYDMLTK